MAYKRLIVFLTLGVLLVAFLYRDKFDPESIRGKRVMITGASTGIGEQLAYWYSKLGARVLITARREAVLQKVVAKCKELGAQEAFYLPLDMGRLEDTERLVQEAKERFGGLDHLMLNHIASNYLHLWGQDQFDRLQLIMDVNFRAYVALATYAIPMLAESKGSIGVVSSVAGQVPVPFTPAYCASKFALHGFFGSLRHDFTFQDLDISITEHIIGSINTTNAVEFSKAAFKAEIFATTAEDTAFRIMEGTAMRERKVFFPSFVMWPVIVRDYVPTLVEKLVRFAVQEDAVEKLRNMQIKSK